MSHFSTIRLSVLAAVLAAVPLSASVVGDFTFANCPGGGVTVSLGLFDFFPPSGAAAPHDGCIETGGVTSVTFAGGSIVAGEAGTINDLGFDPAGVANAGFISFPGVAFNLTTLGPGSSNTNCSNAFATGDPSCSVSAGSPVILTPIATGTAVSLTVSGTASDAVSCDSSWTGAFTTQLIGLTPAAIQAVICGQGTGCTGVGGHSITSTYSFAGNAQAPEGGTVLLLGSGLVGLSAILKRRLKR